MLKTLGYVVSAVSVVLLGMVSWESASEHPRLLLALMVGMASSIAGMALRWVSYLQEQRQAKAGGGVKPPISRSSSRASASGVRSSR